ncbi:hypothetical protein [Gordonia liuliyuniae]|nr:hypothetical protein [Gordonia liuliyuniae]
MAGLRRAGTTSGSAGLVAEQAQAARHAGSRLNERELCEDFDELQRAAT